MAEFKNKLVLSVLMPVYNEEDIVENSIQELINSILTKKISFELIVINDGSTDSTENVLNNLKQKFRYLKVISYSQNKGKGYAIRKGIQEAQGTYVLYTDIDLAYPIDQIPLFLNEIDKHHFDGLIGSRVIPGSSYIITTEAFKTIYIRHSVSRLFNFLVKHLLQLNFSDTQCGIKCFRTEAIQKLVQLQRINNFSFDVELLLLTKRNNLTINQFPVTVRYSTRNSKVKIIRDSIFMFVSLLLIKYFDLKGEYKLK